MENKYWQNFAELNNEEDLKKVSQDEFKEELPFEDLDEKGLLDAKTPRRDFLKYLGFSTAAATLAASCKVPVRKAIPYIYKPENVTPGVAKYYATTFVQDGEVIPAVAKVRDGRPIKIEGNELSSLTRGGTSPRMQASVLDLYDTYRLTHPSRRNGNKFEEIPTYEQADAAILNALAGLGGAPIVLLTNSIVSPSTRQIISDFLGRYPGSRHVQYDAISYNGILSANEASTGRRSLPSYEFDKAKVIVSLGADFLGTWINPVQFARQYSYGRKLNEKNPQMSRHYQFESYLSMTGACADERFTHRPSETGAVALALYAALGGQATPPDISDAKTRNAIQKVADHLNANRGASLVVCGSNDPNIQTVVNAINSAIGANGTTINTSLPVTTHQGSDKDMVNLVNQMNASQIGALLVYGANPAYNYFDSASFITGLKKVRLTVSFNEKMDETTELSHFSLPSHHYLESWGDAEARPGYISFIQPTIFPLFKTRPFQAALLRWSTPATQPGGPQNDYETFFREFWTGRLGGQQAFEKALRDGLTEPGGVKTDNNAVNWGMPNKLSDTTTAQSAASAGASTQLQTQNQRNPATANQTQTQQNQTPALQNQPQAPGNRPTTPTTTTPSTTSVPATGGGLAGAIAAINSGKKGGKNEVVLYQKVSIGSGSQTGNPWLLELPDPISKATWGNYALISESKAKELGIKYKSVNYEYYPQKPIIRLSVNNKEISLPAMVIPGMNADTIAVAVGFGRSDAYGKASAGVGQNAFPFARFNGTTIDYYNDVAVADKTFGKEKVAQMQIHNSYEERTEVVKETTLATFLKYPNAYHDERAELAKAYAPKTGDYRKEATLYGDHVQPGLKWGMSVDLNSCIGCNACVVACHAENNVPVVGKKEVLRYHDMHWLRIDRYFVTDAKNTDDLKAVVFQPMLCQHCDNAPCENVCPVAATPHSNEGINMMAYNRCIGTRYCANNCPYKVRRFNWADYTGADSFGNNQKPLVKEGGLDEVVLQMNDELTRMVLNPDVVVRSRGVMEKCTFCIQRIQEGKLKAKTENREFKDGDVQTACQQACPTSAIVFGNANDPNSAITQTRKQHPQRMYYVIESLHTLPNVNYLAKIRNSDEILALKKDMSEHAQQKQEEGMPVEDKQNETH